MLLETGSESETVTFPKKEAVDPETLRLTPIFLKLASLSSISQVCHEKEKEELELGRWSYGVGVKRDGYHDHDDVGKKDDIPHYTVYLLVYNGCECNGWDAKLDQAHCSHFTC